MQNQSTQTIEISIIGCDRNVEEEERMLPPERCRPDSDCESSKGEPLDATPTGDDVKRHRRNESLRQRFEKVSSSVQQFVADAEQVAEQAVIKLCSEAWHVCPFTALPKWLQDNEFLHTGHRPPLPSFWLCFKSIFRLHTETGNIWTHGLPALVFLILFAYSMITLGDHQKQLIDQLILALYYCTVIVCLSFSAVFHTCNCHSPQVQTVCSKLDYCGIIFQNMGSEITGLYYVFYNSWIIYLCYISVGIILCVMSLVVSLWTKFGKPKFRPLRAAVFLALGISNVVPCVHWAVILEPHFMFAFYLFVVQGLLYVVGALLYANRIPERIFPGKCDYLFQSHQIFHIMVVLAATVHLATINGMAKIRLTVDPVPTNSSSLIAQM